MGELEEALADVQAHSCICRPTRTLLRVIEGLNMDARQSLIVKLQARVSLSQAYGFEAEDSPRWPDLTPEEIEVLHDAMGEVDHEHWL